ncbi:MAG TPA: M1 family aminopeptidase [Terriglobales bacterium]|nr:M1 family aminopeptidase [Terriglobales bacterium]
MPRLILILLLFAPAALAQAGDALQFYRALRTNGLDRTRVYRVRDAQVDIEDIHLTLTDGVIALLQPVAGHTTGAFFAGEGEVLVFPPTQAERESLALHTGHAVLEERFTTGYFRLSDAFTDRIMAAARGPADDPQSYVDKWDPAARSMSEIDALHLLAVLTRAPSAAPDRHVFHARLAGTRLGTFDVYLDTAYEEQVFLGQANLADGRVYYDIWAAFRMRSARGVRSASQTTEQPATELGRRDITVRRYTIDARIEPPHQLEAEATLDADVLEGGGRALLFQLSRYLRISSIDSGGVPAEFIQNEALEGGELARRGNDVVAVLFPQPLQAGEKLKLRFRYAGPVMTEAGGGLMYVGARGIWYPNQDLAMADYDVRFTYPAPWTLLATGKRVSEQEFEGLKESHWVSERPIPLAGFNLGEYVSSSAKARGTPVESFAGRGMESAFPARPPVTGDKLSATASIEPRPMPAAHAPLVAEDAARAVEFLSARIAPFPYSSLALTQVPGPNSMGWPGLIFLSGFVYLSPEERRGLALDPAYEITYARLMLVHEVAHEWFGDAVMRRGYRDAWMMEAIANYYALLMLEKERPADSRALLDHYRERLLSKTSTGLRLKDAGPVTLGTRLFSSRVPGAYEMVLYGRGTWLMHMLRHLLREGTCAPEASDCASDELFLRTLRQLYLAQQGRSISAADLQKAFEQALPRSAWHEGRHSLDWFFEGWVNGTAIPRLELHSVRVAQRAGKPSASGSVLQHDAPTALVTPVPVYARVLSRSRDGAQDEKLVYLGRVFADGPETTFHFAVPTGTRNLALDPYGTILRQP